MAKDDKLKSEAPPLRPIEEWRERLGTPNWLFAAAKTKRDWPQGREVSETEYRAALRAAENEVIG